MCKKLLIPIAISLFLITANAQDKPCPGIPGQTTATHRFYHEGETIDIALRSDPDCDPVSLTLHWTNGRNNGSNFNVTFLDANNHPTYAKQISGFMTGVTEFPLSSFEPQPVYGSAVEMVSVPTTVRIQAVSPFAGSAILSYNVTRIFIGKRETGEEANKPETNANENEVSSIHDAARLIGATRLQLVQIELKTNHPFPVKDVPLQLQIGKRVFVDELTGDYTGRKLTLSLTPQMFQELNDGDEIVAFFARPAASDSAKGELWRFGKLRKTMKQ